MTTKSAIAAFAVATLSLSALVGFASSATAASSQPHGLAGLNQVDQLPVLDPQARTGLDSTYSRDGGLNDQTGYLYEDSTDRVYSDLEGPGEITRIWATSLDPSDVIHIYFDGETTPRISMNAMTFFSGSTVPFRSPLVLNSGASSGGYVSYLPLPFSQSVRVGIAKRSGMGVYVQVGYQLYSPDTAVTTWTSSETGGQDSTTVRTQWNSRGTDPKPTAGNSPPASGTVTVPASGTSTLLDIAGPKSISSIRLQLPGIGTGNTQVPDDGRAFGSGGSSTFTVKTNSANTSVTLTRRFDYSVGNQKANVYVGGAFAGTWFDSSKAIDNPFQVNTTLWKNSTFTIPASLTAGKSSIQVQIAFVSSDQDWNEFTYWVNSVVGGTPILTDTVDVGNSTSETEHSYSIVAPTWSGARTFYYPYDPNVATMLNQLSIQIYWDGSTNPAVNAPLGSFFGLGQYGYSLAAKTLMMGLDSSGYLYMYFAMPFQSHAKVDLSNSGSAISGVNWQIQYKTQTGSFDNLGYFTTSYVPQSIPASNNHDVDLLNVSGQGTVVGMTISARSLPAPELLSNGYQIGYDEDFEGDEKFYVDGNQTPVWHGTGVEDFGNGGFGWSNGFTSTATDTFGSYTEQQVDATNWVSRYSYDRVLLDDNVNFNNHIRLTYEHGLTNDIGIDELDSLVYYYYKPSLRSVLTDTVDVGDGSHGYTTTGTATNLNSTLPFTGDYDDVYVTDDGKSTTGSAQFAVAINSANQGVTLRNRFETAQGTQEAQVYVDGALVGTWRAIGDSSSLGDWFKENDYYIPGSFTAGKSSITVKLVKTPASNPLSEYRFQVYSVLTGAGAPLPQGPGAVTNIANADFESGTLAGWTTSGPAFTNAQVTSQTTQDGVPFNQNGTYHYWGYASTGDNPTGSMRTSNFLLGGNGLIKVLVGGGNDITNLNIALVRASDNRVLLSATGKNSEADLTRVMDAAPWVGTEVYLKATDTSSAGWGHLNLDNFQVPVSSFANNLTGSWANVSGTWTDVAAGLQGTSTGDSFRLDSQTAGDVTIDADLKVATTGAAAIVFRSNAAGTQFYAANIDQTNQRVLLWGPGTPSWSAPATIVAGTTYHLKVVAARSSLKVYFSGYMGGTSPILSIIDSTYSSGLLGVNVWNGTSTIQNLTVS